MLRITHYMIRVYYKSYTHVSAPLSALLEPHERGRGGVSSLNTTTLVTDS